MNMCWNGQGTMVSHFEGVLVDPNLLALHIPCLIGTN
jgi:hypothetical protein